MITHLKKVIVLIKKRHLNSIFHVIIPSSHPLATHSTYSVAILTGTAAEGLSWDKRLHTQLLPK